MSSPLGRIVMNTRERGVSNDINRLQDLLSLDLMEVFRGFAGLHQNPNGASAQDRNAVLRGLAAVPGAAGLTVDVQEGYASIIRNAGAPSTDDSSYRLAHNRATQVLTLAAADPVNPRYDLIEATFVDDLVESQNRDIYDPVTGTFTPAAVDKVRKAGCTLTVTTGVAGANPAIPAFSAAATDRIPIAAVRVPALAGSITTSDILDLRPLWVPAPFNRMHGIMDGFGLETDTLNGDSSTLYVAPGAAVVDGQLIRSASMVGWGVSGILDPLATPAAGTWIYAYLFACKDGVNCRPRVTGVGLPAVEGFIVLSEVAPTRDGYPSAVVTFPTSGGPAMSMFSGHSSTRGLYLGCLRMANATQIQQFYRASDWIYINDFEVGVTYAGTPPDTQTIDLGASNRSPAKTRMVKLQAIGDFLAGALTDQERLQLGAANSGTPFHTLDFFIPNVGAIPGIPLGTFDVPLDSSRRCYATFNFAAGADRWNTAATAQRFRVIGYHDPVPRVY